MMRALRRAIRPILFAAAILTLAVGVGIATGAIPSAGGQIHACYSKLGGAVRVIDKEKTPPQQCTALETPFQWNAKGTPGPQGPQGPQGPRGPQGPQGQPGRSLANTIHTVRHETLVVPQETFEVHALCPVGEVATGGGHFADADGLAYYDDVALTTGGRPVGWRVTGHNPTGRAAIVTATVYCTP